MRPRETFNPDNCIIVYCAKGGKSDERVRLALGLTTRSNMAVVIQGTRHGRPFHVVVTKQSDFECKKAELIQARR